MKDLHPKMEEMKKAAPGATALEIEELSLENPKEETSDTEATSGTGEVATKPDVEDAQEEPDEYAENHEEIAKLRAAQAAQGVDGAAAPYIPPEHDGELPFLQLEDIYKIYQMGSEEVHANDGISVNIYHGEFVAIVGKSGSGKSTLMNIIGALDVPSKGEYLIQGVNTSHMSEDELASIRNHKIGFIFQQYNLLPKDNLVDNVSLPLLYAGLSKSDQRKRAMKQLERVGLADKWMQHPAQLSGGQQQRVSIARALAGDPELILADEPTGALDSKTSRQVMGFLQDINKDGTTVVMITHDNALALEAKRVIRISDGRVVFDGKTEDYAKFI